MIPQLTRVRRTVCCATAVVPLVVLMVPAKAAPSAFPVTVKAANGSVVIAHAPARIVSLSPSATQDLYAVGAGAQVVAVDSYSTYPPQAPRTRLSAFSPNAEAIAAYRPDLVVVADDENHIVAQLRTLRIPVLLEPAAATLGEAYAEIRQLAAATGHPAGGRRVVADMRAEIAAIVHSLPRPNRRLSVYNELDQDYYSATSRTFIGQLDAMLGLVNIADKAPGSPEYPQLSGEYIIASDPDLIVLADTVCCGQNLKTVAARPGWNTIAAVKDGAVVPVNDAIASQWGPRVVIFLREVAAAVKRLEAKS